MTYTPFAHWPLKCLRSIFLNSFFALVIILMPGVSNAKAAPESFADLAKQLLPSVVNISTTQVIEGRSGMELPKLPPGSPFEDLFKEFFDCII